MTEVVFVVRLLEELVGKNDCCLTIEEYRSKAFKIVSAIAPAGQKYEFLVVDGGSDSSVLSAILDRHSDLASRGYEEVFGVRDLYPYLPADLSKVIAAIRPVLPTTLPNVHMVVALQEVEAWFVQEELHFPKIDPNVNRASILASSGYDIDTDHAEDLVHPAAFLDNCYRLEAKRYKKRRKSVSRTVKVLDYENLCVTKVGVVPSFKRLLTGLEAFLLK